MVRRARRSDERYLVSERDPWEHTNLAADGAWETTRAELANVLDQRLKELADPLLQGQIARAPAPVRQPMPPIRPADPAGDES